VVQEERAAQETVRENQQVGAFVSTEEVEGFIKRNRDDHDDHDLRQLSFLRTRLSVQIQIYHWKTTVS
jgi:hypothetical protein